MGRRDDGPSRRDDNFQRGPPRRDDDFQRGPPRGPPRGDDGPIRGPPRGDRFDDRPRRGGDDDFRRPAPRDDGPRRDGPPRRFTNKKPEADGTITPELRRDLNLKKNLEKRPPLPKTTTTK